MECEIFQLHLSEYSTHYCVPVQHRYLNNKLTVDDTLDAIHRKMMRSKAENMKYTLRGYQTSICTGSTWNETMAKLIIRPRGRDSATTSIRNLTGTSKDT